MIKLFYKTTDTTYTCIIGKPLAVRISRAKITFEVVIDIIFYLCL